MSTHAGAALITGAAQGIGSATAARLARDGVAVGIADVNGDKARAAAREMGWAGVRASSTEMDVADPASVEAGVASLRGELGPITILVNNAGIYRKTPIRGTDLADWKLSLDVMLTGPLLVTQAVVDDMIEARWGRIINLGSLVSHVSWGGDLAYCTAKTGILGFTRSLAAELAQYNVCVNTICPGNILTDMLKQTARSIEQRDDLEPGQWLKQRHKDIPIGRLGSADDVAKVVAFLCSDAADYITGQALHVNGGLYQL